VRSRLRAVLPLALVALAASGCGGGEEVAELVPAPPPAATASKTTTTPSAEAPRPESRLTVQLMRTTPLRARPGGPVVGHLKPHSEFRSPTVLPVVRQEGAWLGVITTALPNGRIGWISANAKLVSHPTRYSVAASLTRREVVVRRAGRVVLRFPVAIGSPSTPTPVGRFAVTDKLETENPQSPYGCCILALSAHQPHTPQGWGGGDRVAIHATNLPETIGTAASLGCLRGPADAIRQIIHTVPIGTLVTIRR
jgi:lipoprotein-anchoring transpeptidase ErfK/SrfK